ncbi:MAG: tRNA dihydrouridine synthase DusB [Holosporales bacterium]|jgi:tRNA-dihydrouridine synthase B|nr:tRNA dihydrouridine synthase DusB [Holosporales bacterium]
MQIGNVKLPIPVILAPMAGVTDYPFRKIVNHFGAGLVYSEMVASRAIMEALKNTKVRKRLHFFDASIEPYLVSMQIVGNDPEIMADAARFSEQLGATCVDINMGCPVKKVVNIDCGAALMKDEALAAKILRAVVAAVRIPVTVKMRLGWDFQHINVIELAKMAENEGVCAVAVHGRTRSQFYEGTANWQIISEVKQSLKIPVIGNGDVKDIFGASELLKSCNAVMIGRGACGRPWLLRQVAAHLDNAQIPKQCNIQVLDTIHSHLALILETYGEDKGTRLARKHLDWYSKGYPGAAAFRSTVNSEVTASGMYALVDEFFSGLVAHES